MSGPKEEQDCLVNPDYLRWSKRRKGIHAKLIPILRAIIKGPSTVEQIHEETGISITEIRKAVKILEKKWLIKREIQYRQNKPGRPKSNKYLHTESCDPTGRPEHTFATTTTGINMMKTDPEVKANWSQITSKYPEASLNVFDSCNNLMKAIKKNENLRKYKFDKDHDLLSDYYLEMLVFRSFLFPRFIENKLTDSYDELVDVIGQNVLPQHRVSYYKALEASCMKLLREAELHRILMKKMAKMPEIKEHLSQQKS